MRCRGGGASFNSLFEMHAYSALLKKAALFQAFNSLFEMPIANMGAVGVNMEEMRPFNSLFEMPGALGGAWQQNPPVDLSILYLRCGFPVGALRDYLDTLSILYLRCSMPLDMRCRGRRRGTFNSLFEMRVYNAAYRRAYATVEAFNSLFEMLQISSSPIRRRGGLGLSILYLRC